MQRFIRRKKDGIIFAYSDQLAKRLDMEVIIQESEDDTPTPKAFTLKDMENMKRPELMKKASELKIPEISNKNNAQLIMAIYNKLNE